MAFTKSTIVTNNISSLPNEVKGSAPALKAAMDKYGVDDKAYINAHIDELTASTAAANIGAKKASDATTTTVQAELERINATITGVVVGTIPDGSIADTKLSNTAGQIKDRVSIAEQDIDLLQTAEAHYISTNTSIACGGTANALTGSSVSSAALGVTSASDKRVFSIIPSLTNTAAATLNLNGTGVKSIKKFDITTDAYIDLVANDLKKNGIYFVEWSHSNGFFVLASRWGSNIKSIQKGTATLTSVSSLNVTITSIDPTKSIVLISFYSGGGTTGADDALVVPSITNATTLNLSRGNTYGGVDVYWQVIEFNNVKSKQSGSVTMTTSPQTITVTSVDTTKCMLIGYSNYQTTGSSYGLMQVGFNLFSDTQIIVRATTATNRTLYWQLIQFE